MFVHNDPRHGCRLREREANAYHFNILYGDRLDRLIQLMRPELIVVRRGRVRHPVYLGIREDKAPGKWSALWPILRRRGRCSNPGCAGRRVFPASRLERSHTASAMSAG
jgi:hypothetical protein